MTAHTATIECAHTHRQTDTCIDASTHTHYMHERTHPPPPTHLHPPSPTFTHPPSPTHLHPPTFQCRNVDTVWFEGKLWQSSSDVDLGREDSASTSTHTHTEWQPSCMCECTVRGHIVTEAKGRMHKDPPHGTPSCAALQLPWYGYPAAVDTMGNHVAFQPRSPLDGCMQ